MLINNTDLERDIEALYILNQKIKSLTMSRLEIQEKILKNCSMPPHKLDTDSYVATRIVKRIYNPTLEEARALNASTIEEIVDKTKIDNLIAIGVDVPHKTIEYLQIRLK